MKSSHRKFRSVAPATLPQLIALLHGRTEDLNLESWRSFQFPADAAILFDDDPRRPAVTVEHEALEIRYELEPGTDLWRSRGTLITPALLRTLDPAQIRRVSWRYRKGGA